MTSTQNNFIPKTREESGDSTQPYRVYENMAKIVASWYNRSSCIAFIGFVLVGISMLIYCVWYPNSPSRQLSASAFILVVFCISAAIAAYGDVSYHTKLQQLYTGSK
jgi:DMSO reductase anchor subunit